MQKDFKYQAQEWKWTFKKWKNEWIERNERKKRQTL